MEGVISREELAFRSKSSRAYISGLEAGRWNPTIMSLPLHLKCPSKTCSRTHRSRDRALPAPYLLQVFRKPEIMPKLRNCSGS